MSRKVRVLGDLIFIDKPKVPLLNLGSVKTPGAGHSRHKSCFDFQIKQDYENILPQNDSFDDSGVVPATKSSKLEVPDFGRSYGKTSRNLGRGDHKRCLSQSFGPDDFPNDVKNEAIVNNLYGENHTDEIDRILGDEHMSQRKKEEMLFNMLDQFNLDEEDDLDVSIEESKPFQEDNTSEYIYHADLKNDDHSSNLMCGRILSKIMENKERCSTVVLKLIDLFLSKNSHVVMENLVYRFLNNRVCKEYGFTKVKELIRQSNPRQRLIDDVREMHYITEESLKEYLEEAAIIVHDSMSLYPINNDALINAFDDSRSVKAKKVSLWKT